jgi:hypothetical protein
MSTVQVVENTSMVKIQRRATVRCPADVNLIALVHYSLIRQNAENWTQAPSLFRNAATPQKPHCSLASVAFRA